MSVGDDTLTGMKRQMPQALVRLQCGVFSREQALESGITVPMINARLRSGAWRAVCRGVYADAAVDVDRTGMMWAALLFAGRFAVLSHETAAELHKLGGRTDRDIHITVPATARITAVPGVRIHRSRRALRLALADATMPYTSAEETVLDLVDAAETFDDMCGWVTRLLARPRTTPLKLAAVVRLRDVMARRDRIRWRLLLGPMIHATITGDQSVLEHRYERDVERAHGLPEPVRQAPFVKPDGKPGRRDRAYPEYRVVIELDGQLFHQTEDVWADKDRDNASIEAGHEPLRYGWKHVTQQPCATAAQVSRVLLAHGWQGQPSPCSVGCPIRGGVLAA
jgi:hypothetical protein